MYTFEGSLFTDRGSDLVEEDVMFSSAEKKLERHKCLHYAINSVHQFMFFTEGLLAPYAITATYGDDKTIRVPLERAKTLDGTAAEHRKICLCGIWVWLRV